MDTRILNHGDYVDVRASVVAIDRDGAITIRVPGRIAFHQFVVEPRVIRGIESRGADAIAADIVGKTY